MTRRIHDLKNELYYIRGIYVVVSAHGLRNEGSYMCSTFASDQCLKNESDKLQVFLVVGLKNLERNTL